MKPTLTKLWWWLYLSILYATSRIWRKSKFWAKYMLYTTTIMISITTVIQTHLRIQNTGGLCCFRYERFNNFLTSVLWHEERDTILTVLTPFQYAVHLVIFKIFVKIWKTQLYLQRPKSNSQLILFQNTQILRIISSRHDVIHTPVPFPVWEFIMTMMIVISFARERKLHQLTINRKS